MEKNLTDIQKLCQKRVGFNPYILSIEAWLKVIHELMKDSGSEDLADYYNKISSSSENFQALVERIIVAETWFFRDQASFVFLAQHINQNRLTINQHPIHILSIPCSSGEEPYSIAMTLLKCGFSSDSFRIDAMDISQIAIQKAIAGAYTEHSFRGKNLDILDRFFDKIDKEYRIKHNVRDAVHFDCQNILQLNFLKNRQYYDIIFCRNLLIYLAPEAQLKVNDVLHRLLKPKGILIVGPAERELVRSFGFETDPNLSSSAFHLPQKIELNKKKLIYAKNHAIISTNNLPINHLISLEEASRLADQGKFEESTKICHSLLDSQGPFPEGLFLLGLIQHARGNEDQAEDLFLKTLYLQPEHYQALVYLKLLAEKKGDLRQADIFHTRMQKVDHQRTRENGADDK